MRRRRRRGPLTFKRIRIAALLLVLALAMALTYIPPWRAAKWEIPLRVEIYPINGDGRPETQSYVTGLRPERFAPIAEFMAREAKRYGVNTSPPVRVELMREIESIPPQPPKHAQNRWHVATWSLRLRWWAFRHTHVSQVFKPKIRLFVLYYIGDDTHALKHSLGLEKGLLGVVHAYARSEQDEQNAVVIAHELLHTLGASDKYEADNNPIFPQGYAQPTQVPLYPQVQAEIMGGRIPTSSTTAAMPVSLVQCVIGADSAREIHWIKQ